MYNPLFVLLQPQKWYTFGLQFGTLWHYYLHTYIENNTAQWAFDELNDLKNTV